MLLQVQIFSLLTNRFRREYIRGKNPLFIPETVGGKKGAARAFYVIGEYDAACFAPFGIDNQLYAENDPLDAAYAALKNLAPVILEYQGKGVMRGILTDTASPVQSFDLGRYRIEAKLDRGGNDDMGGGLIIQTGEDEFLCTGRGFDLFFSSRDDSMRIGFDIVDEGVFEGTRWIPERRLNGDETHASTYDGTGLRFPADRVTIQKTSLYWYK